MSGVELVLGIVGAVPLAIEACQRVAKLCTDLKHAEEAIAERCTRLRSNCIRMEKQLEIMQPLRGRLDERTEYVQDDVLAILTRKLVTAESQLKGFMEDRSLDSRVSSLTKWKRSKFVMLKDGLDRSIKEIEEWQRISFSTLWFILAKAQSRQFDDVLNRNLDQRIPQAHAVIMEAKTIRDPLRTAKSAHVFAHPDKLSSAKMVDIAFSSTKLVDIDGKWRLLDRMSDLPREKVRELAVKLQNTDPSTFGLLKCIAVVHDDKKERFNLVLRMPEKMSRPETLRARILANSSPHSLSDRFRIATQLARAVCSIHAFDIVHKSIRPENVLLFDDQQSSLGSAFLVGFARVRWGEDETHLVEDADWEKNLYRHPQRQRARIRERYVMQHDIYSLGVCLLEIGLWTSFVEYSSPSAKPTRSQTYTFGAGGVTDRNPSEVVKSDLVSLATKELPESMGNKYAKIVRSCLTCLDLGNEDFGDESELQESGSLVAVRYIEKVLMQLGQISV